MADGRHLVLQGLSGSIDIMQKMTERICALLSASGYISLGAELSAQVKSRQRVREHGEAFTNEREANAMLDMIKQETERIESRFLEPACGDDNFLAEVLRRKLAVVKSFYRRSPVEYMRYAFVAVASIYGVDLLEDNARDCRKRLLGIVKRESKAAIKSAVDPMFLEAVSYVLEKNILCGDALTVKNARGRPITFAEWSIVTGDKVKRRDYLLREVVDVRGGSADAGEPKKRVQILDLSKGRDAVNGGASQPVETKEAAPAKHDWVYQALADEGFELVDTRGKGGCLWAIGGGELDAKMGELANQGARFEFSLRGSKATDGRSAWWLEGYPEMTTPEWNDPPGYHAGEARCPGAGRHSVPQGLWQRRGRGHRPRVRNHRGRHGVRQEGQVQAPEVPVPERVRAGFADGVGGFLRKGGSCP